ncbi:hypothetical protein E4O05_00345 [Treponema sp. OMZ 787]|uniref:hypothetical protein n=1 Tax=Treponema sp. OMZ 787 TaxID=2563669 RepID=UPI0020A30EFD|nr:hypothetical protein [Treponema sp. OMZ 787]UTC62407.1 hypothetical protein E4O05_00345 [Treponema sp. OMZ 787]
MDNKRNKQSAINLCKEHISDTAKMNKNNTTFASKNAAANNYWINPNTNRLNENWWLLLNDTENKNLHIFFIPTNSISIDQVVVRSDKINSGKIELRIKYNDETFTDKRSGIQFCKWYKDTIPFV